MPIVCFWPLVVNDGGVDGGGINIPPGDVSAFAGGILSHARDPEKRAAMGRDKVLERFEAGEKGTGEKWTDLNGTYLSPESPSFRRRPESREITTNEDSGSRPSPG